MKYTQVNVKMTATEKKQLESAYKAFCRGKKDGPSFNAYLASFWKPSKPTPDPLFPKVPVGSVYKDERGEILNILNRDSIRAIALITSKKGSERSNHWHKTDWHYLYVVSGKMQYLERDVDEEGETMVLNVNKGEMEFTGANKVHCTRFLEDTVLLSVGNYTDHDEDTVKEKI